jgi:Cu+-exporting ATPase
MHPQVRQATPGACPHCGMALRQIGESTRLSFRPLIAGATATTAILALYFAVLTPISGWDFTLSEVKKFWPYLVALAGGFGLQVGLYVNLKHQLAQHHGGGKMVVASGTTSTAAMISCCTHYLANVLPLVGAAGIVTFVAQYQVELFWVGLLFNAVGILFVVHKTLQARRQACAPSGI